MSIYLTTHLGPYVECSTATVSINPHFVREAIREALCLAPGDDFHQLMRERQFHIWLPNLSRPSDCRDWSWTPREGIQHGEITMRLIAEEVDNFRLWHADALLTLMKLYGVANVRVCWGLNHCIH